MSSFSEKQACFRPREQQVQRPRSHQAHRWCLRSVDEYEQHVRMWREVLGAWEGRGARL